VSELLQGGGLPLKGEAEGGLRWDSLICYNLTAGPKPSLVADVGPARLLRDGGAVFFTAGLCPRGHFSSPRAPQC